VPLADENPWTINWSDVQKVRARLFNVTKASGNRINFTPNPYADVIINDVELGKGNCLELFEGKALKLTCIKVKSDRLGNITPVLNYD